MLSFIRILFIVSLLLFSSQLISTSQQVYEIKQKENSYNYIKYGLFNPQEWKIKLGVLLTNKIDGYQLDLEITPEMLSGKNIDILDGIMTGAESIGDIDITIIVKDLLDHTLNDIRSEESDIMTNQCLDRIEDKIPSIAESINNYLNNNKTEILNTLKTGIGGGNGNNYIIKKLNILLKRNKHKIEPILKDFIKKQLNKTISTIDIKQAQQKPINPNIDPYKKILLFSKQSAYTNYILSLAVIFLAFIFLTTKERIPYFQIDIFILSCLFLTLGVFLPMISILAKLDKVGIILLGEEITFNNQVIIYRSKSILQLFQLLFEQGIELIATNFSKGIRLLVVAIFIIMFSAVFPIIKLISSLICYLGNDSKFLSRLITKLGKWSMADVFVVAIALSFLGFNGLIDEQLTSMSRTSKIISNNESMLEPGFYMFLMYCIFSISTSKFFTTSKN